MSSTITALIILGIALPFPQLFEDAAFKKPSIMTLTSLMSVNSLFRAYLSILIPRAASCPTCLTNIRLHLLLSCSES